MTSKEKYDFVKSNHKAFAMGGLSNKECAAELGVSQARISQMVKKLKGGIVASTPAAEVSEAGQQV